MTDYVVGFLFSEDRRRVALIRKTRPEWQAGMLNGPGGKIEQGEVLEETMRREFLEEAGCDIENWQKIAILICPSNRVYFFRAFTGNLDGIKTGIQSCTDERIDVFDVDVFLLWYRKKAVWPTCWMIQMCLDDDVRFPVIIEYQIDGRRR
uniref:Nudix hydrolase domain-containing protein n=1 Tax=viral metagenome TaxID=1070528 RepID=A0A6M3ILC8_9ZZZZ